MEEILRSGFEKLDIPVDDLRLAAFRRYYELLREGNAVMNLTSIEGEENTARLHFLDCCALLRAADFRGASVIDVGTGAGFPGLPLRIAEPSVRLTLLDSQLKRVEFLRRAVSELGLEDVRIECARAEEAPDDLRGGFDFAVSRAVARLNALCELCLPFVRVGGVFIAMKGPECPRELEEAENAVSLLGGKYERTVEYSVPGTDARRCAAVIRKTAPTPAGYPRRWARIAKKPL